MSRTVLRPSGVVMAMALTLTGAAAQTLPSAPPAEIAPEAGKGVATFVARQEAGQWLGENLDDKDVFTPNGVGIGSIDDVLFDQSGRVVAVILEVGGFLGIREKRIAVPFSAIEFSRPSASTDDPDNTRLILRIGRAELEQAPAFKSLKDRR